MAGQTIHTSNYDSMRKLWRGNRSGILRVLELWRADCALGMNFFRDISAAATAIFGGRSGTWQRQLRKARALCMDELRRQAFELEADAVIAVDFDYSEIGKGSMFFVVATGTAVRLAPERSDR